MASMVVISAPDTELMGGTQGRRAFAFLWTVQAPHKATPQPNFVPVRPRTSRRYHSSGISGLPLKDRSTPLTLSWTIATSIYQAAIDTFGKQDNSSVARCRWFHIFLNRLFFFLVGRGRQHRCRLF